jgi:hypothetical protein
MSFTLQITVFFVEVNEENINFNMYPITSVKSDNQKAMPNFVALTVLPSGSLTSSIGRLVKDGVQPT